MVEIRDKSFADRLADLLKLEPDMGRTVVCTLPQGTFVVTVSAELSPADRNRYEMMSGNRSVHIEGFFKSYDVEYHCSFDDYDGDGKIGIWDEGGLYDSFECYICQEPDGMPQRFYSILTEIIVDYLTKQT